MVRMTRPGLAVAVAFVATLIVASGAPPAAAAEDDQRARQAALYAAMQAAPDDPALMAEHARVSVALRDYEAAISTLERALLFTPGDPRLQLELGAAYFRLGSLEAARFYVEQARAGGLPPAADALAARYLAAIDDRGARSRLSGHAMIGGVLTDNANLGPSARDVRFGGVDVTLDPSATPKSDAGVRAVAQARHDYDLGRPNLDVWRTDLGFYGVRFFQEETGDIESLSLTTGPSLSLDADAYGPKARPFVGFQGVRQDDSGLYLEYSAGVEATDTFDARWSGFARVAVSYRDYASDLDRFDALIGGAQLGLAYAPRNGVTLIGLGFLDTERADDDSQSNTELGARVAAIYEYDPNLREAGGLWRLTAYAQASRRWFDEADPAVDPSKRRDTDLRLGLAHRFRFHGGWGAQVDLDVVNRDSAMSNFGFDSVTGGLSLVYEF